jgi:hypothetical protein
MCLKNGSCYLDIYMCGFVMANIFKLFGIVFLQVQCYIILKNVEWNVSWTIAIYFNGFVVQRNDNDLFAIYLNVEMIL